MKDDLFLRGARVPMTKEVVRTQALDRLQLHNAKWFIDIGAGTGSVSLEAAMRYPQLQVSAIERNPDALALMAKTASFSPARTLRLSVATRRLRST